MEVLTRKAECSRCTYFIPYESMQGQIGECRISCINITSEKGRETERWTKVTANHLCKKYRPCKY